MLRKISIIISLIFISILIYLFNPFDSKIHGVGEWIYSVIVLISFAVFSFIILFISIYKEMKNRSKIEYYPFIFLFIAVALLLSFGYINEVNIFNKETKINAEFSKDNLRYTLYLFEDNCFSLIIIGQKRKEIIKGEYQISNNIVKIDKRNIVQKTDSIFTNEYRIEGDSVLIPLKDNFPIIKIETFENN